MFFCKQPSFMMPHELVCNNIFGIMLWFQGFTSSATLPQKQKSYRTNVTVLRATPIISKMQRRELTCALSSGGSTA